MPHESQPPPRFLPVPFPDGIVEVRRPTFPRSLALKLFQIVGGAGALALLFTLQPVAAQEASAKPELSAAAKRRIENERRRQIVADALTLSATPGETREQSWDNFLAAERALLANADDVLPFLVNELDSEIVHTFPLMLRVLGQIEQPEAEQALLRALERAEADESDFGATRERAILHAIADQRNPIAAAKMVDEPHRVWHMTVTSSLTLAEVVIGMLGSDVLPVVHEALAEFAEHEELSFRRNSLTASLRRAPDASSLPLLAGLMLDDNQAVRREAARALQAIDDPRAVEELMTALIEDNDDTVRFVAANALERIGAPLDLDRLVERLDEEADSYTRGVIYRIVARQGGRKRIADLLKHGAMPDGNDRRFWTYALGLTGSVRAVPPLVERLDDANYGVVSAAAWAISDLDSKAGIERLREMVGDRDWNRAKPVIDVLDARRDPELAELLFRRVLRDTETVVRDPHLRHPIEEAVMRILQYDGTLTPSEEAALQSRIQAQTDAEVRNALVRLFSQRRRMKAFAGDEAAWIDALHSERHDDRYAAYHRLAAIGSEEGVAALGVKLRYLDVIEGAVIVRALAHHDTPAVRALVVEILTDPHYDLWSLDPLRNEAAWAARRLGGPEMIDALAASAERLPGRHFFALAYLAQLAPERAIPLIHEQRHDFFRAARWSAGNEIDWMDWIVRRHAAGRDLKMVDRRPLDREWLKVFD